MKYLPEITVNEFNDEAALEFRRQVIEFVNSYPDEPLRVYINSYGGEVESLAAMVETINSIDSEVHTICLGKAYSCGAILFSYGDIRYMGKLSTIMIHEISAGTFGSTSEMENNLNEILRQNKLWLGELAKNCGMTFKELRSKMNNNVNQDLYLSPKLAKKFGIADKLFIPKAKLYEAKNTIIVRYKEKEEQGLVDLLRTIDE